mgnify:CR=1 FL=1
MSEPAPTLTGGEVAAAAGGRVVSGDADAPFGVFGIDSRAIVAGQLFVAIAGERHDGPAFLGDALDRGTVFQLAGHRDIDGDAGVNTFFLHGDLTEPS